MIRLLHFQLHVVASLTECGSRVVVAVETTIVGDTCGYIISI